MKFLNTIDKGNTWIGKAVSWLVPLLVLELVYDTVARYLFNAPTAWSYDISYMLYGALFMFGSAWTLKRDEHVRIEVLSDRLPPRGRAVLDLVGYLVFFFPVMIAVVIYGTLFSLESWMILEKGAESMWQPPIYYFKSVLPLAGLYILLQGLAECIRCLQHLRRGGGHEQQS